MSKMKGNRETIKFRAVGKIGNRILILVKHGNKPFQKNRGTDNPLEELHLQGKMKGGKLL